MKTLLFSLSVLVLSTSNISIAETKNAKKETPFEGTAELGFVATSGNTETSTINGKINLINNFDKWRNSFNVDILRTRSETDGEDVTTADRLLIGDQIDYKFTETNYFLFAVDYDQDEVSDAYDYFYTASAGYGQTVIKEKDMGLSFEIGLGLRDTTFIDGTDESEEILRLKGNFFWKISESTTFTQMLKSDAGEETRTRSESALSVKINSKFSMKTSIVIDHFTGAESPVASTDKKLAVTLVYALH